MDKIAIFNQKGGVGKTTISVNIAACFTKFNNKKVLVVDCDAQSNSSSYLLSLNPNCDENDMDCSLVDCLNGLVPIEDVIKQTFILGKTENDPPVPINLFIAPTDSRVDSMEIEDILILKNKLAEIEDEYDVLIFDCPPQRTQMTLLALCASDYVLVPVLPDSDSIKGYGMLIDLVNELKKSGYNETLQILGLFLNAVKRRDSIDTYFLNSVGEEFGHAVFSSSIRNSTIIRQARMFSEPVCYFKPSHPVTDDMRKLSKEILTRINSLKRKVGK